MKWKWLRKLIKSKIETFIAEYNYIEKSKALYPAGSLAHERLNLAMALTDLRISMWIAILGDKEK